MPGFIHLRVHSEYSIIDSIIRIKQLVKTVAGHGMPAVALTDQSNLFATVKFYKAAIAIGIKPIIGVDLWLKNHAQLKQPYRLTLLCQNITGYQNLTRLVSRAYLEGQHLGMPCIDKAWLAGASDGLIALSGAREGDVGQALLAGNQVLAGELAQEWAQLFPHRYYLELQRTGHADEESYLQAALTFAATQNLPVVATNPACFLREEDFEAHEARVCIHEGSQLADPRRVHRYSAQQYLRTPAEMKALFADIPEALENTIEIAKRCNLALQLGKNFLPNFPIPNGLSAEEYLSQQSQTGLKKRLDILGIVDRTPFQKRLDAELNIINSMGYAGYFLIVADFILWAKNNGIPVGPGRGSGAGSLVAYALQIIDINPLDYELLFERFLNPERVSMPDFDIDFCMDGRDRVIDYVADKYGRESVSQIITYGSMAAKAVVRDVGRVLGYPYGFVDKIAKLIPFELGMTLDKALEQEEELRQRYKNEEEVATLLDLAKKLEGLVRNAGKHAGGVVISPSLLTDFTPLYCEADGENLVSQFDKNDVEAVGLVKFDFLGLRTLTIISWALEHINLKRKQQNQDILDITLLPTNDPKTFALIKSCATTAVFQLESRGMKDLVKRLQPDCFEDIIAILALFRPGPLQTGTVDDFINRKHGRAKVEYPHPALENILSPTYGTIVYQEQVMQIAQVLAGYTLGSADLLRSAMGKKKLDEMAKHREIFIKGAQERQVSKETATSIFDLMEKFALYAFNKSHTAAYALITYQTAWLKAHYPAEFMAAVLSSDMDNTDKVISFLRECQQMKLKIIPPDINLSEYKFTVSPKSEIIYGLGAIKGAGEAAISLILQQRKEQGPFKSLFDLCNRIDPRKVNRRVLEAFIKSGALDSLGTHRAALFASLDHALQAAEQRLSANTNGQQDLFGEMSVSDNLPAYTNVPHWTKQISLEGEKETLGTYLSGHPLEAYEDELKNFTTCNLNDLSKIGAKTITIAGLITGIRIMFTKRGDRMAFVTLEDRTSHAEITVFSELYDSHKHLLIKDQILIAEGDVSLDEFTGAYKLVTRNLFNLEKARENYAKYLSLHLPATQLTDEKIQQLENLLKPYTPGNCPVQITYENKSAIASFILGDQWRIKPSEELLNQLRNWLDDKQVTLQY